MRLQISTVNAFVISNDYIERNGINRELPGLDFSDLNQCR